MEIMKMIFSKILRAISFCGILVIANGLITTLLAQGIGPPPALPSNPATPITWGNPLIYAFGLLGYALWRLKYSNRK